MVSLVGILLIPIRIMRGQQKSSHKFEDLPYHLARCYCNDRWLNRAEPVEAGAGQGDFLKPRRFWQVYKQILSFRCITIVPSDFLSLLPSLKHANAIRKQADRIWGKGYGGKDCIFSIFRLIWQPLLDRSFLNWRLILPGFIEAKEKRPTTLSFCGVIPLPAHKINTNMHAIFFSSNHKVHGY